MSTETTKPVAAEPEVVINKEAFRELSQCVKHHLEEVETSDNPSKKTVRRLTEIKAALSPVRDLIIDRTKKWIVAKASIVELKTEIAHLQDIVDREPIKKFFELRRLPSAFSGVEAGNSENAPIDMFTTDSDPKDVVTRLKPIISSGAGVVGMKVFVTDTVAHIVLFSELISVTEAREERQLNIDADSADALKVYLEGMTIAVAIADMYTKLYGAWTAIPLEGHKTEEALRMPAGFVVADAFVASEDGDVSSEESDEGDDEDEDGEETGSAEPTAEEIQRRLDAEEDTIEDEA